MPSALGLLPWPEGIAWEGQAGAIAFEAEIGMIYGTNDVEPTQEDWSMPCLGD